MTIEQGTVEPVRVVRVTLLIIGLQVTLIWLIFLQNSPVLSAGSHNLNTGDCPTNVATQSDLVLAIDCFNDLTSPSIYDITLTSNISLTSSLPDIDNSSAGVMLMINGGGYAIDGQNLFQILSIKFSEVTIENTKVSNGRIGTSGTGAGIFNLGTLTIKDSTISNNSALEVGGGISNNGILIIDNSTVNDNSAFFWGGGIYNTGMLTMTNSTVSNNSIQQFGGGIVNNGTMDVRNSTITNNSGSSGGGIFSSGTLNIANSIVANSMNGADCVNTGTIGINIQNLIEDNTCSPAYSGDPLLGTLADNGGTTLTHLPMIGSSVVDMGDDSICVEIGSLDQRGYTRVNIDGNGDGGIDGDHCDIGSVEVNSSSPTSIQMKIALTKQPFNLFWLYLIVGFLSLSHFLRYLFKRIPKL